MERPYYTVWILKYVQVFAGAIHDLRGEKKNLRVKNNFSKVLSIRVSGAKKLRMLVLSSVGKKIMQIRFLK